MNRLRSVRKHLDTPASSQVTGMAELTVGVPAPLLAAIDEYARAQGVSRAEATGLLLYSAPWVAERIAHAGVSSRDVLGP